MLKLAAAALVLGAIFLPGYPRLVALREEKAQYRRRIEILEEHNRKLENELIRLREDPAYIEKKARERLGVVRKGEIIYLMEDDAGR